MSSSEVTTPAESSKPGHILADSNLKRDYISRIHLCLNKLEQTPPSSPQAAPILKSILEFIPLKLSKTELRRDDDLRRLFLQRNFFNSLVFYIDSAFGQTVMAAIAIVNSLFIRHYIDIPTTIRLYLPSLMKAMTSTQLSTDTETLRFLHNILAFITMLLKSIAQMEATKQTYFYNMFKSEIIVKSLQYTFQRYLLFFTRHWYDATLTEEELLTLDKLQQDEKHNTQSENNENDPTADKSTTTHQPTAEPTVIEETDAAVPKPTPSDAEKTTPGAEKKPKVKSSLYTPRQSMDLFYQGVELLLFPFIGFINIHIMTTTPSDLIVSIFAEMMYLARDFLYKTYISTVPMLCTGEKYYFTQSQAITHLSFYQLYFHTMLVVYRCAMVNSYDRSRRKLLTNNWFFQTLLYFLTVYHQSTVSYSDEEINTFTQGKFHTAVPPKGSKDEIIFDNINTSTLQINYIKQTILEYKFYEESLKSADDQHARESEDQKFKNAVNALIIGEEVVDTPLFQNQDVDHLAVALTEEEEEEEEEEEAKKKQNEGEKRTEKFQIDKSPLITSEFIEFSLPRLSSMIFAILRRLFPMHSAEITVHYDLCRALCFSGLFRYFYGHEILFPRPHANDLLNISPQYSGHTSRYRFAEEQSYIVAIRAKLAEEQREAKTESQTQQEQQEQQEQQNLSEKKDYIAKYLLPGSQYSDNGALYTIFPLGATRSAEDDLRVQKPSDGQENENDEEAQKSDKATPFAEEESQQDYLAVLWMSYATLKLCDYRAEPTHAAPHPSSNVPRDESGTPIRDQTEFPRYFIQNCQLYQFMLRWLSNGKLLSSIATTESLDIRRKDPRHGRDKGKKERDDNLLNTRDSPQASSLLQDLCWEILEDGLLQSVTYKQAVKVLVNQVVTSFKQQQYDQISAQKTNWFLMGRYIHDFWSWKNRRIQYSIDLENKKEEAKAKAKQAQKRTDQAVETTDKSDNALQSSSEVSDIEVSDIEGPLGNAIKEEEEMRQRMKIEQDALGKVEAAASYEKSGKDVEINDMSAQSTLLNETADKAAKTPENDDEMPSLESNDDDVVDETPGETTDDNNGKETSQAEKPKTAKQMIAETKKRIEKEQKALYEQTCAEISQKSQKNSEKYANLYTYPFPHTFLEQSPHELVKFTQSILAQKGQFAQRQEEYEAAVKACGDDTEAMLAVPKIALSPEESAIVLQYAALEEDLTVFLMTKAPISFQYFGFSFYFYKKPHMDKKFELDAKWYDNNHIFSPHFFAVLQQLTKMSDYSTANYSLDEFVMSDGSINYFTFMIALYQRAKADLNEEPRWIGSILRPHFTSIMSGIVNSTSELSKTATLDDYKSTGLGGSRYTDNVWKRNISTTPFSSQTGSNKDQIRGPTSMEDILRAAQKGTDEATAETAVTPHHEIVLNEFGESEYILSLDRNLAAINIDSNENCINNALFSLLTEMKILAKKSQIFIDTGVIPDSETSLTMTPVVYEKIIKRTTNIKTQQDKKVKSIESKLQRMHEKYHSGSITQPKKGKKGEDGKDDSSDKAEQLITDLDDIDTDSDDESLPILQVRDGAENVEQKPDNTEKIAENPEKPENSLQEDNEFLLDDEQGEMIDPNDPTKIIKRAKTVHSAKTYRFKPSLGALSTEKGLVFDTQDQDVKKRDKLMAFSFDLLQPDPLEKHEWQTFKFSDRNTHDPGVSEYVQHVRDHEQSRDFTVKQLKYTKLSYFFEGVGFEKKLQVDQDNAQEQYLLDQERELKLKFLKLRQMTISLLEHRKNEFGKVSQKLAANALFPADDERFSSMSDADKDDAVKLAKSIDYDMILTDIEEDLAPKRSQIDISALKSIDDFEISSGEEEEEEEGVVGPKASKTEKGQSEDKTKGKFFDPTRFDDDEELDEDEELEYFLRGVKLPAQGREYQRSQDRTQRLRLKKHTRKLRKLSKMIQDEEQTLLKYRNLNMVSASKLTQMKQKQKQKQNQLNSKDGNKLTSHTPSLSPDSKQLSPKELQELDSYILSRRADVQKKLGELTDLRRTIIEQLLKIEEDMFPESRPLPDQNDETSAMYKEYMQDILHFERFKEAQTTKLQQIDKLSKDIIARFDHEYKAAMNLKNRTNSSDTVGFEGKSDRVNSFLGGPLKYPQHDGSDTAMERAANSAAQFDVLANMTQTEQTDTKSDTKPAPPKQMMNDLGESDYEEMIRDQEAMKKHYEASKNSRTGEGNREVDSASKTHSSSLPSSSDPKLQQSTDPNKPFKPKVEQLNIASPAPVQNIIENHGKKEIKHTLTLPVLDDAALKIDSSTDNSYKLTRSTTRSIPTLPMNSILRHHPQKRFLPRNIPVILPVENKYIPICHTKPMLDDEIWTHFDNDFSWIDNDPRKGTTSYGDKTIKREIDARLGDDALPGGFDIDKLLNDDGEGDDGDLTDVFSALNKKKESVKNITASSTQSTAMSNLQRQQKLDGFVSSTDMDELARKDPIIKQELDVTREQLDDFYEFAKTWTYEDLYMHFIRFEQKTIYDMKQSMEFFLRLRIPSDFQDLEIKPNVQYMKMSEDLVKNEYTDGYDDEPEVKKAEIGTKLEPTKTTLTKDEEDDNNDDVDIHQGMSVNENEHEAKKTKLGDEDKLFAKIAIRRQKLIARFQLPALYRYIHERHNGIPPPPLVREVLQAMQAGPRDRPTAARGQLPTSAERQQLAQAQMMARKRAEQGGNAALPPLTAQQQSQMIALQQQRQAQLMAQQQQQAQMIAMQQRQAQMARPSQPQLQPQLQQRQPQMSRAQLQRQQYMRKLQEEAAAKKK